MNDVHDIESTWRIALPVRFTELQTEQDWDALRLPDGSIYKVPWPVLSPKQIVDAFDLREDWQLPDKFVPLIGDFHNLVGLDYSVRSPSVNALNDARESRQLFDDFDTFLSARFLDDETPADTSGIVEEGTWLDL